MLDVALAQAVMSRLSPLGQQFIPLFPPLVRHSLVLVLLLVLRLLVMRLALEWKLLCLRLLARHLPWTITVTQKIKRGLVRIPSWLTLMPFINEVLVSSIFIWEDLLRAPPLAKPVLTCMYSAV